MRLTIAKLGIAAAVIVAAVIAVCQLDGTASVAWAEVPERMARSSGSIRRILETWEYPGEDRVERQYKVVYHSPRYGYRVDYYDEDNYLCRQRFISATTRRHVHLNHKLKSYTVYDYTADVVQWNQEEWVNRYLSLGGKYLGRRRIGTRQAEGFEVAKSDPNDESVLGDSDWIRLWVDVESGLPVLQEDVIANERCRCHAIEDRWLWNVDFQPEEFLPPQVLSDYERND
jgi:hypothetical protein